MMDIKNDWNKIRAHFKRCFRSNFYVSIASVAHDNKPTVTPIGSLFLNDDQNGFYFEKYPSKLPTYAKTNKHICVLAVNSNSWFWVKSLFRGRFRNYPAIKLYGKLGERRKASEKEKSRLNRRMATTKGFRGNAYLWGDMEYVREVVFDRAEKINLGDMIKAL